MEEQLHHHRFQKKHEIKLLDHAMALCSHIKQDIQASLDVVVQLREKYCDRPENDFNRLCVEIISGQTSLRMDNTPDRCLLELRSSIGSPDSGFVSAYSPSETDEDPVDKTLVCSTPKRARRVDPSQLSLDSPREGHRTPKQIQKHGNYFTTTAMKIEREISACIRSLEFKIEKHVVKKK